MIREHVLSRFLLYKSTSGAFSGNSLLLKVIIKVHSRFTSGTRNMSQKVYKINRIFSIFCTKSLKFLFCTVEWQM